MVTHQFGARARFSPAIMRLPLVWGGGAGTADEVLRYPAGSEMPLVRFSLATITERQSTFSDFAGYQRLHVLLQGETELCIGESRRVLSGRFPRTSFSGAEHTTCQIRQGPVIAWNVVYVGAKTFVEDTVIIAKDDLLEISPALYRVTLDLLVGWTPGVSLTAEGETLLLSRGDALIVERASGDYFPDLRVSGGILVYQRVHIMEA